MLLDITRKNVGISAEDKSWINVFELRGTYSSHVFAQIDTSTDFLQLFYFVYLNHLLFLLHNWIFLIQLNLATSPEDPVTNQKD